MEILFPALSLLKSVLKRKTTRTLEVTRWICYCFKVHAPFSDMSTQTTKPFTESTGAEVMQVLEGVSFKESIKLLLTQK